MRSVLLPDKSFLKTVFLLALPIAIQNMSISILSLIDVAVIKRLGDEAMGAVSLANQLTFITNNMTFGIASGASIYLSRYFGEKNGGKVKENFVVSIFVSIILNIIVAVAAIAFPGSVMKVLTDKAVIASYGREYLRIVGFSYIFIGVNYTMTAIFRSAKKAHYVLVPCFLSMILKTVLNFLLIYGVGIFPQMGIKGAALSTLVAKITEFLIYCVMYIKSFEASYRVDLTQIKSLSFEKCKNFLKDTYAVIINESLWGTGIALFSIIFGRMSVEEIAALNIAKTLEELFNAMFYGFGIGAVVVIGQNIGAGEYEKAKLNAKRYTVLGVEVGVVIMVLMLSAKGWIVDTFFEGMSSKTISVAKTLIVQFALLMPFRSTASTVIMGIMRAGGRQKRAMLFDVMPIYAYSLPVGIILGLWLKLPLVIVLPAMYAKRIIKAVLALWTSLGGYWYDKELIK